MLAFYSSVCYSDIGTIMERLRCHICMNITHILHVRILLTCTLDVCPLVTCDTLTPIRRVNITYVKRCLRIKSCQSSDKPLKHGSSYMYMYMWRSGKIVVYDFTEEPKHSTSDELCDAVRALVDTSGKTTSSQHKKNDLLNNVSVFLKLTGLH